MLLAGPLCAIGWKEWQEYQARVAVAEAKVRAEAERNLMIARIDAQIRAVWLSSGRVSSQAEREIWDQQKSNISWESFPESQPPP